MFSEEIREKILQRHRDLVNSELKKGRIALISIDSIEEEVLAEENKKTVIGRIKNKLNKLRKK